MSSFVSGIVSMNPPDDEPSNLLTRLRSQLAALKVKRTVGDKLSVVIPEAIDGSHCDLAVAFAQAVWGLGRWGGVEVKETAEQRDDEAALEAAVIAQERREAETPWWES
jgi:hypothetical protein